MAESALVVVDATSFAAGWHALAEGGISVFAVEPATVRWIKRPDTLPMTDFYASIRLKFENFDLLQREGDPLQAFGWRHEDIE